MICIFGNTTTENCRFCTALSCPSRPYENVVTTNNIGDVSKLEKSIMKEKITAWVARDKNGTLKLYVGGKPFKGTNFWKLYGPEGIDVEELDKNKFPQVKWEDDEPTEVELTIKIKE